MDNNKVHDLAIVYAQAKLQEYQLSKREAVLAGNTDISEDEIKYLKPHTIMLFRSFRKPI